MSFASKVLVALLASLVVGLVIVRRTLDRRAASPSAALMAHADHGGHHDRAQPAVDWTRVTDRDLAIAELFIIARRQGAAEALRALESLASADSSYRDMGHVVAHALGRFVVAQRDGDPAVYAECREVFQAGCNHGVMEGYFTSPRAMQADATTPGALDSLCARITRPSAARLVSLECSHGMGHGLLALYRGDVPRALGACDHLRQRDARDECHDGVFMENAVRGTTSADMRVGDAAVRAGAANREQKPLVRRGDLAFPCSESAEPYRAACWKYQPVIITEETRGDPARTLDACARAPAAYHDECYFGIGKQGSGWWEDQRRVVELCNRVPVAQRSSCISGAVESYLDEMWTVERAMSFCGVVAPAGKAACYETIGSRLALMRTDYPTIERECQRAETGFAHACTKGVALVWLRR
ncbi:MAG TPA: hypothetical protein VJ650_17055 [Gemmatimonadaceae bacterium]|nr:hypothetical protein [Gemmatimonadaceae bacterium]